MWLVFTLAAWNRSHQFSELNSVNRWIDCATAIHIPVAMNSTVLFVRFARPEMIDGISLVFIGEHASNEGYRFGGILTIMSLSCCLVSMQYVGDWLHRSFVVPSISNRDWSSTSKLVGRLSIGSGIEQERVMLEELDLQQEHLNNRQGEVNSCVQCTQIRQTRTKIWFIIK